MTRKHTIAGREIISIFALVPSPISAAAAVTVDFLRRRNRVRTAVVS